MTHCTNPFTAKKIAESDTFAPHSGPLSAANAAFHHNYDRLVCQTLDLLGGSIPVVAMIGDDIWLLNEGGRRAVNVIPQQYHQLKAVCHLAFGTQLWLMANRSSPLDETLTAELRENQSVIQNSLKTLTKVPNQVRSVPMELLSKSASAIGQVLEEGRVDVVKSQEFADEISLLISRAAAQAVRLELDGVHRIMSQWRAEVGDSGWKTFYVVICGTHQPRYRHAARQYFGRLLGEQETIGADGEDRIIYGEGIRDIDAALDLLARHLIDQRASLMIFGDRRRLQQDLLADAAASYLDHLLPLD